jgi:hypothetical protein
MRTTDGDKERNRVVWNVVSGAYDQTVTRSAMPRLHFWERISPLRIHPAIQLKIAVIEPSIIIAIANCDSARIVTSCMACCTIEDWTDKPPVANSRNVILGIVGLSQPHSSIVSNANADGS